MPIDLGTLAIYTGTCPEESICIIARPYKVNIDEFVLLRLQGGKDYEENLK